jgi:hypothetical protein
MRNHKRVLLGLMVLAANLVPVASALADKVDKLAGNHNECLLRDDRS